MPWGNVTITGQDGQDIYLDGVYDAPCGTAPGPFVVTYGKHTFETLDAKLRPLCAGDTIVNRTDPAVTITLAPVAKPAAAPAKPANVPPKKV